MTAFAQAALAASDLINTKFANTRFSGKLQRQVIVEAPKVESTGGGKQARESIVLRTEKGDAKDSITCGFLDVGLRSCELRTFAVLSMLHRERYQEELDLNRVEYDRFLGDLRGLLDQEGFVIKMIEAEDQKAKAVAAGNAPGKGGNMGIMIAIGGLAALVVVAVVVLLLVK